MYQNYQVSFHTGPNDQIAYVALYGFSPGEEQGYVYLPGEYDPWYGLNVRTVFRGVEGKLFRAWDAWERVARPLIEKAEHLEADPLTRERIIAALANMRAAPSTLILPTMLSSRRKLLEPLGRYDSPTLPHTPNRA